MSNFDFDLFVIGAGSGGVRAARTAANHGAKVAIAEEYLYGGTCVVRGCVPKKLLVYASRFRDEFDDAAGFGWGMRDVTFDWATLIANKDREIERISSAYKSNLTRSNVRLFSSRAELVNRNTVRIPSDDRTVTASTILIATGGRPFVPNLPGADHAITSNEAFELDALPSSVVIVGGGYIAVEFACIFNSLGTKTTLLYRGEKILRGFDEELANSLTQEMSKRGIDLRCSAKIASIDRNDSNYVVELEDGKTLETDKVMFATGRAPNTAGLGLEVVGVKLGERGEILVDERSRTSVENIYAVGDVTDRINLTPVAIREGQAFADTVFGLKIVTVDHELVPTAVFSTPEIGTVGLPEHVACQRHANVDIYKASFRPLKNTVSGRDERTLMKLIVDANTDRIVGCHMMGPDAAEIVQMAAIAMRMKATKADFDNTIALHPSAAEELVTMREKWVRVVGPIPVGMNDTLAKGLKSVHL